MEKNKLIAIIISIVMILLLIAFGSQSLLATEPIDVKMEYPNDTENDDNIGDDFHINITAKDSENNKTGDVSGRVYINATNENGRFIELNTEVSKMSYEDTYYANIDLPEGTYEISAYYTGDKLHNPCTANFTIKVGSGITPDESNSGNVDESSTTHIHNETTTGNKKVVTDMDVKTEGNKKTYNGKVEYSYK